MTSLIISHVVIAIIAVGAIAGIIKMPKKSKIVPIIALIDFSQNILQTEASIIAPNSGYKMYRKRMQLAKNILQGDTSVLYTAAIFVATLAPDIVINSQDNYRWLIMDNPTGRNIFECEFQYSSLNIATSLELQIFSKLAGVCQEDLL